MIQTHTVTPYHHQGQIKDKVHCEFIPEIEPVVGEDSQQVTAIVAASSTPPYSTCVISQLYPRTGGDPNPNPNPTWREPIGWYQYTRND